MPFAVATEWSMSPLNPVASRPVKLSSVVFSIIATKRAPGTSLSQFVQCGAFASLGRSVALKRVVA
eukprot:12930818-Prorocentrum_lima.AAC.1